MIKHEMCSHLQRDVLTHCSLLANRLALSVDNFPCWHAVEIGVV